jgi:hypothetical protein
VASSAQLIVLDGAIFFNNPSKASSSCHCDLVHQGNQS